MRIDTVRMIVGFTIILSHIASFGLVLFGGPQGFSTQERAELSLLIGPVFAVYIPVIVRQFLRPGSTYDRTPTHPALYILSIGTASLFSIALPATIISFQNSRIESFTDLKMILGILETALGLYTGAVIERVFGRARVKSEQKSWADETKAPAGLVQVDDKMVDGSKEPVIKK
jgi:hypothetical protein